MTPRSRVLLATLRERCKPLPAQRIGHIGRLPFGYPGYAIETVSKLSRWLSLYFGLRRIYTRIKRDPARYDYQDVALTMHDDDLDTLDLFHHTEAAEKFAAAAAR